MAAAAEGLLGALVALLETHRGRDRAVRTLGYGCQLTGGALAARSHPTESPLGQSLLAISAQLSHCRTVLRLFDDLSMLAYSRQYGLGPKLPARDSSSDPRNGFDWPAEPDPKGVGAPPAGEDEAKRGIRQEEDPAVRWLSVANNVADQLYYPCEHLAWAADAKVIRGDSGKWWVLSTLLWATSLLLGIARSLRILCRLRRRQQKQTSKDSLRRARVRAQAEALTIAGNLADLCNAVHWLPPGVLWAGRFPPWLVGLLGTTSSLIGVYQTYAGGAA